MSCSCRGFAGKEKPPLRSRGRYELPISVSARFGATSLVRGFILVDNDFCCSDLVERCCAAAMPNAWSLIGCWRPACRAERGAGAARRGGDRKDGASGIHRRSCRRLPGYSRGRVWSRRWSFPLRAFTSCVRRCSAGWGGCRRPQREALGTAFGLSSGTRPDRFLVGLALLSLLSNGADRGAASRLDRRCAVGGSVVGAGACVRGAGA